MFTYVYNLFDAYFNSGNDVEEETGLKFYPDIRMQFAHNVPQPTLEAYYGGMLQWKW